MSLAVIDDEVVRRAQRGDQNAFAEIVRTYQAPVFNYVLRLIGDRGLAEDLTQEVFIRVYQSLPRFSYRSKFTTWLFQVAKNRVVDELRSWERRPRPTELPEDDTLRVVDPPVDQAETIDAIWRAVDALPLDLKLALLLRDVAGFSYEEISEVLDTTLATVKWRIFQAREAVTREVADQGLVEARPARRRRTVG